MPILIHDQVKISSGVNNHPYKNATGTVLASRLATGGVIEHQVQFTRRTYSTAERARGEDRDPNENISWFRADEIMKAQT